MPELSAQSAAEWLTSHGVPSANAQFEELGGGISNKLVLVSAGEFRAVLKQPLGKLRTQAEWNSDPARIFREAAAMRWMAGRIRGGRVPRILYEDAPGFTIAMEAAPAGAEMWKTQLFRGEFDPAIAHAVGVMLGSMIAASQGDSEAERLFGDQAVFEELRVDPYYRYAARQTPEAAEYIARLIERSAARRVSLVHGDWSPKNLLIADRQVWAIDWEVVHYGDPSFDAGFLLNHLVLKSVAMPQHRAQLTGLAREFLKGLATDWVEAAALEHLPALMLARVEGKSRAEYLDPAMRAAVRERSLALMHRALANVEEVFER